MRVEKPWTVLLYAAASGKLHQPLYSKLDAVEELVTDRVNVVAQLDQPGNQGACRFELHPDGVEGRISSPGRRMGVIDMAAPSTLTDFVEWGMLNYPAEHTALIVMGEGDAWRSLLRDEGKHMTSSSMAAALKEAQDRVGPLAVLGLDCENAGCLEVGYELRDTAELLVTSEAALGPGGWPLAKVLGPALRQESTPEKFADALAGDGLTATRLGFLADVVLALGRFSDASLGTAHSLCPALRRSCRFGPGVDIADLVDQVVQDHGPYAAGELRGPGKQLADALAAAVASTTCSIPGAYGLSLSLVTNAAYQDLALARETSWSRVLKQLDLPKDEHEVN